MFRPTLTSSSLEARWLTPGFLAVWVLVSFVPVFFARNLDFQIGPWPFSFWLAAQGIVVVYILLAALYAWRMNRYEEPLTLTVASGGAIDATRTQAHYHRGLKKWFTIYVLCLVGFLVCMVTAEALGLSRNWVGGIFLIASVALYAAIGIYNRTSDPSEYYVAGRRIPPVLNGMACAADWMSAASFISLAGGLYLQGFSGSADEPGGLAYVLGWTGGFCLVAFLVAPNLRRYDVKTVPDFFGKRFGGKWPRLTAAIAAVLCSFTYIVAQIYGVGLITSRLTGVHFEIGILLGLGGVLVCSFLGGMRAVTWTQVAQYCVLAIAYLLPVGWMAYNQLGNPVAPVVYGQQLAKIEQLETQLLNAPAEKEVLQGYQLRRDQYHEKLQNVEHALTLDRQLAQERVRSLNNSGADPSLVFAATRDFALLPRNAPTAQQNWTAAMHDNAYRAQPLAGLPRHAQVFAGDPHGTPDEQATFNTSRINFLALMFCLMVGTAGLPHLLTRYFTTPSVAQARTSVAWSLFFIALVYLSAPALAVFVKYQVMNDLVGLRFDALPDWISQWSKLDPGLISVADINADGILQFGELKLGADLVMLVTPELGGMPYVVSGLVAAGGLAAALSTADGLLLTIGNAFAHDMYRYGKNDRVNMMRRVMFSKFVLMVAALLSAYVATQRPAGILFIVAASFSIAGAAFVPAMVMGLFWQRTTRVAAVAGMWLGLLVTLIYLVLNTVRLPEWLELEGGMRLFGIGPNSAGVFGIPVGFLTIFLLSWWGKPTEDDVESNFSEPKLYDTAGY
jgi:cation/acetate symporter